MMTINYVHSCFAFSELKFIIQFVLHRISGKTFRKSIISYNDIVLLSILLLLMTLMTVHFLGASMIKIYMLEPLVGEAV